MVMGYTRRVMKRQNPYQSQMSKSTNIGAELGIVAFSNAGNSSGVSGFLV